jgi:hypothetical protein
MSKERAAEFGRGKVLPDRSLLLTTTCYLGSRRLLLRQTTHCVTSHRIASQRFTSSQLLPILPNFLFIANLERSLSRGTYARGAADRAQ